MLNFEPGLIFWTTVSFLILVALLYKAALPPLLSFLSQREKIIADSLEQASNNQKRSEDLVEQYREKLAEANAAAEDIIVRSKEQAKQLRSEITKEAEKQAELVLERARQDIDKEKNRMIAGIRREIAGIVVSAAGQILQREVRQADNRRIIEENLRRSGYESDRS